MNPLLTPLSKPSAAKTTHYPQSRSTMPEITLSRCAQIMGLTVQALRKRIVENKAYQAFPMPVGKLTNTFYYDHDQLLVFLEANPVIISERCYKKNVAPAAFKYSGQALAVIQFLQPDLRVGI